MKDYPDPEALDRAMSEYRTAVRSLKASIAELPPVPSTEAMRRLARQETSR